MNDMTHLFGSGQVLGVGQVVLAMVLSFVLSSVFVAVYRWTFRGFTYSRSFIQAMVLGSMITALLIMAIGNNLARGLGILGTLAIIRFRTQIRDPRDIIYLFGCLAIGISCGSQLFDIAIAGTLVLSVVGLYLHVAPYTSRTSHQGMLRFSYPAGIGDPRGLTQIMGRYASDSTLIAMREAVQGDRVEYAWHVRLIDPSYRTDLVGALQKITGVTNVNLVMHRQSVEL